MIILKDVVTVLGKYEKTGASDWRSEICVYVPWK